MGEIARAVKAGGGTVTGVIPEFLISKERGNGDGELGEMIVTRDMHERKTAMFDRADAFIALPGGIGTLEEVIEMMTWAQLGRHEKPIIFANIEGFWNPLLDLLAHMAEAGFIHTSAKLNPIVVNDARKILAVLKNADQR